MTDPSSDPLRGPVLSAPGKMMIAGEYVVLDGGQAIVAAVDRRAQLWLQPTEGAHVPAEARAARAMAEAKLRPDAGPLAGELALDVSALRADGKKLGLGSSAAAAAAAAGLVYAAEGHDVEDAQTRAEILKVAFEGHRAVAPRGSGADVAASVLGGFLRFARHGDRVDAQPLPWPEDLHTAVVWTETEVRTSDMLDAVAALRERDPKRHDILFDTLRTRADLVISCVVDGDTRRITDALGAYGEAMGELGDAASVNIVDDTLRAIDELARACGGRAKPSGAGGGDVALAAFPDRSSYQDFLSSCGVRGLIVLSLGLGAYGLVREHRGVE